MSLCLFENGFKFMVGGSFQFAEHVITMYRQTDKIKLLRHVTDITIVKLWTTFCTP